MLLQLAVCARANGLVAKANQPPLVVQAVYLSKQYHAERYLAYADAVGGVFTAIRFDLADPSVE